MRKFLSFSLFICFIPFLTAQNHTVQVKGDMLCATTQSYSIEHGSQLTLQAQPDSGYVFKQWADGNTDNPRVVLVESDITYEAHYTALPAEEVVPPTPATMHTVVVKGDELCSTMQSYSIEHGALLTLQAQPDSGFVFQQWADGNTDNPRVVTVESDITYEAHYTALPAEEVVPPTPATMHTVVVKGDELCSTMQSYSIEHGSHLILQAQPDSGYVFKQWSDGNTDNPRVVLVESDITYEAHYTALPAEEVVPPTPPTPATMHTVVVKGDELCSTTQSYSIEHGAQLTLQAQPDSGFVFQQWADGNTDNPRVVTVESDITYVATYTALPNDDEPSDSDMVRCTIYAGQCATPFTQQFKKGTELTIHATPNPCNRFVRWSDGNTDNPRTIVIQSNTTLYAEFAPDTFVIKVESADENQGTVAITNN